MSRELVSIGKDWALPWDGSRLGWEHRRVLLRKKVPRLVRVELEATFCVDRVEIRRHVGSLMGTVVSSARADMVGSLTNDGLYVHDCPSQGPDSERLCLRVVDLTFQGMGNRLFEWRALKDHPFWTEFLRDVRDLWTVAEVMLS